MSAARAARLQGASETVPTSRNFEKVTHSVSFRFVPFRFVSVEKTSRNNDQEQVHNFKASVSSILTEGFFENLHS